MAIRFWMISDRNVMSNGLGDERAELSYWTSDAEKPEDLTNFRAWTRVRTAEAFQRAVLNVVNKFPPIRDPELQLDQKHFTLFVHGYNTSWKDAIADYGKIWTNLFSREADLGMCVLFSWPSEGLRLGYYPDRLMAREVAPDLADVLNRLYERLADQQESTARNQRHACFTKTSMIAHSMGNFVLQKAMQLAWTRQNQPLLSSLLNQLLMVAADVDNDLFKGGETVDQSDGDAIANLCYRISVLFTGRDPVLGLSAGLKHFGKRRLGRSGLADPCAVSDNVWQVDCSSLISANAKHIHSAYFEEARTIALMRGLLRGIDRQVIVNEGLAPATRPCPPNQPAPMLQPAVMPT